MNNTGELLSITTFFHCHLQWHIKGAYRDGKWFDFRTMLTDLADEMPEFPFHTGTHAWISAERHSLLTRLPEQTDQRCSNRKRQRREEETDVRTDGEDLQRVQRKQRKRILHRCSLNQHSTGSQ